MQLLHELNKIASISCPEKVDRLDLINIYWIKSGMIMGEDEKIFKLDALEVFRILKKWKNSKNNNHKLNQ